MPEAELAYYRIIMKHRFGSNKEVVMFIELVTYEVIYCQVPPP